MVEEGHSPNFCDDLKQLQVSRLKFVCASLSSLLRSSHVLQDFALVRLLRLQPEFLKDHQLELCLS